MAAPDPLLLDLIQETSLDLIRTLKRPVRIGIAGAQGAGKSHLAAACAKRDPKIACFSLDDCYLPTAQRRALADKVSPLFKTRGAPGTHDLELAKRTFLQLGAARARDETPLPRFDKLADGPLKPAAWPRYLGTANITLFDGWCLGATPQEEDALVDPVNALEAKEDASAAWRTYANAQLAGAYADFFARLDRIVFLAAPSWEVAPVWRLEQEAALRKTTPDALPADIKANVARFVLHFERITRHMLAGGRRAEIVVHLDENRSVANIEGV